MRVAAINGSPRGESSNSRALIAALQGVVGKGHEWLIVSQIQQERNPNDSILDTISTCDALVVVFPVYMDALPASLMRFLGRYAARAARAGAVRRGQRVFAMANCGFYEGEHCAVSLEIMQRYCESCGLIWAGGVGVGTGEMLRQRKTRRPESGPGKPVHRAVKAIANAIVTGADAKLAGNILTQHGVSWSRYRASGDREWKSRMRANKIKQKDALARPLTALSKTRS